MIMRFLAPYVIPILLSVIAALGISALWQTHRLHNAQQALTDCKSSITTAVTESEVRAAITGTEALTIYVESSQQDAPAIRSAGDRTRAVRVCEPASRVSMPPVPEGNRQAAAAAQDRADDAAWLSAVADDLETCADALNMCSAQYNFHNRNTGVTR